MSYEKEMVGQKSSKKEPHINYETQMRGEKGHKAKEPSSGMAAGPKPVKLAAGGVGKLRKNEMSSSGMPIKQKRGK